MSGPRNRPPLFSRSRRLRLHSSLRSFRHSGLPANFLYEDMQSFILTHESARSFSSAVVSEPVVCRAAWTTTYRLAPEGRGRQVSAGSSFVQ